MKTHDLTHTHIFKHIHTRIVYHPAYSCLTTKSTNFLTYAVGTLSNTHTHPHTLRNNAGHARHHPHVAVPRLGGARISVQSAAVHRRRLSARAAAADGSTLLLHALWCRIALVDLTPDRGPRYASERQVKRGRTQDGHMIQWRSWGCRWGQTPDPPGPLRTYLLIHVLRATQQTQCPPESHYLEDNLYLSRT